jgi:hypothetical protein
VSETGLICHLCGRTLLDAGSLSGDPTTGDVMCRDCLTDWPDDVFQPAQTVATATFTLDADEHAVDLGSRGPPPLFDQLRRVIPVAEVVADEEHEVTLVAVYLYADGFKIRCAMVYPGEPPMAAVPDLDAKRTAGGIHFEVRRVPLTSLNGIHVEVSDDHGGSYWCNPVLGGRVDSDGRCSMRGDAPGGPPPRPDVATLRIHLAPLPSTLDNPKSWHPCRARYTRHHPEGPRASGCGARSAKRASREENGSKREYPKVSGESTPGMASAGAGSASAGDRDWSVLAVRLRFAHRNLS